AAAAHTIDQAEIKARYWEGMLAGEQLKVLTAIAQSQPKRASWNAASGLVEGQIGCSRAVLYRARSQFLPVIHLWAAWILRVSNSRVALPRATPRSMISGFLSSRRWLFYSGAHASSSTARGPNRHWIGPGSISGFRRQIGRRRHLPPNGRGTVASMCRRFP